MYYKYKTELNWWHGFPMTEQHRLKLEFLDSRKPLISVDEEDVVKIYEGYMKKNDKPNEGFINESKYEFSDISSEETRSYCFPNGNVLLIEKPLYLHVSDSGGHRLYCEAGYCYYVQPREGWYIRWRVREGKPHFVK
jgi:hypothetical protein